MSNTFFLYQLISCTFVFFLLVQSQTKSIAPGGWECFHKPRHLFLVEITCWHMGFPMFSVGLPYNPWWTPLPELSSAAALLGFRRYWVWSRVEVMRLYSSNPVIASPPPYLNIFQHPFLFVCHLISMFYSFFCFCFVVVCLFVFRGQLEKDKFVPSCWD